MTERFSVWAFIETPDGEVHDKVGDDLSAEEAIEKFKSYTNPNRPGNVLGIISEVRIVDGGDSTVAHWTKGLGLVWPPREKSDA